MSVEERLAGLGLRLPGPPTPVGNYLPAVQVGRLVFTSGQTARLDGVRRYVGTIGREVTPEDGYLSARDSALNCLACVKLVAGSLDRVARVVKVVGFVNAVPEFDGQAAVVDGASDLLHRLFGEAGHHVRSVAGVNALPSNVSAEIEIVVELAA